MLVMWIAGHFNGHLFGDLQDERGRIQGVFPQLFNYLKHLPVDYIKIDGSFVRDLLKNPVDQKMIKLIAEIGREAGMRTIAEYVQNARSLERLGELGVDMAQGFFVGRPTRVPKFRSTPISLSARRSKKYSSGQ